VAKVTLMSGGRLEIPMGGPPEQVKTFEVGVPVDVPEADVCRFVGNPAFIIGEPPAADPVNTAGGTEQAVKTKKG
jgi:hypothetical protein